MDRKKLLLKRSAFRYYPEKYKIKRKFTFFFGKYHKYFISCIENIINFTCENADIFNTFDEIYLVFTSKK